MSLLSFRDELFDFVREITVSNASAGDKCGLPQLDVKNMVGKDTVFSKLFALFQSFQTVDLGVQRESTSSFNSYLSREHSRASSLDLASSTWTSSSSIIGGGENSTLQGLFDAFKAFQTTNTGHMDEECSFDNMMSESSMMEHMQKNDLFDATSEFLAVQPSVSSSDLYGIPAVSSYEEVDDERPSF
jgi:hypothetical protein